MGLDIFDISHRIEKTFEIPFSVDDLVELARDRDIVVGDLYDLILKKLHLHDVVRHDIRLNYTLWRELQGVVHCVTRVPLDQVELKTPLESLFPRKTRRAAWQVLRDVCPYHVRTLDYPRIVRLLAFLLAAAMVLIETLQIWQVPGLRWFWPAVGFVGIWMLIETYAKMLTIFAPLRNSFPSGMTSVKDLCRSVLASNYDNICRDAEIPVDERCLAVWQQLTAILVDVLDVDADEITFRSRLARDLGME